jgi:hypothetical protein
MKRSEMIDKLADTLLQFMPDVSTRFRTLIADVLLADAEREGMRPPMWLEKVVEVEGQGLEVFSNVWTPEDAEIGAKCEKI